MTAPLLAVEGLTKAFGGRTVLRDLAFTLAAGEMLALIGPNGAGKSTAFNCINGQIRPDAGTVRLGGTDVAGLGPERMARLGIGRTFQVAETFRSMTVRENVETALAAAGRERTEADALLADLGLGDRAADACGHLAYGDAKRLDLALALSDRPRLLLMDEPTAGMAPAERRAVMTLVATIARRDGIGVLFTEHDTDAVFGHADRVLVLDRGRLLAEGTPADIRDDPRVKAVYLGSAALPPYPPQEGEGRPSGSARGTGWGDATAQNGMRQRPPDTSLTPPRPPGRARWLTLPLQGRVGAPHPSSGGDGVALHVVGLDAFYGAAQILFGVDLTLRPGEVVALVGRNGAGKSTTLKALVGLVTSRRGTVRLDGQDIGRLPTHRIARLGIGFVPEERRIFTDLTVAENLLVGRRPPRPGLTPWTPERLFALFPNLGEMRDRAGGRMSGGEQQMLAIARTLMGNPRILLLDEPSEGLAPLIVDQMAEAVAAVKREGVGILLCEQNLRFARAVLDRACAIERGTIRAEVTAADLAREPNVLDRFLGA